MARSVCSAAAIAATMAIGLVGVAAAQNAPRRDTIRNPSSDSDLFCRLFPSRVHTAVKAGYDPDDRISAPNQGNDDGFTGILINAGSYTHTSYAVHDAIKGSPLPVVEVHISNPEAREAFRHVSVIAAACVAKVAGFGPDSYRTALEALLRRLSG